MARQSPAKGQGTENLHYGYCEQPRSGQFNVEHQQLTAGCLQCGEVKCSPTEAWKDGVLFLDPKSGSVWPAKPNGLF